MPFETIKDNSHPFIVFGDADKQLPWRHGELNRLRLSSTYLRLSPQGFLHSTSPIHALPSRAFWNYAECQPAVDALCEETAANKQLWFPDSIVDVPDNWQQLPPSPITRLLNSTDACSSSLTQRAINILDERYEISLCDLLDLNLDIVFARSPHSTQPVLAWQSSSTSFYEFLILAVLAIYLVTCVSQNIADMFTAAHNVIASSSDSGPDDNSEAEDQADAKKDAKPTSKALMLESSSLTYQIQNAFAFAILIYSIFTFNILQRDVLISLPDVTLFAHTCLYSFVTICFHVCGYPASFYVTQNEAGHFVLKRAGVPGHNISLLTATLLLLSVKVHHSFDNPYIIFLSLLFGWRSFVKIFMCESNQTDQILCALLDLVLFFSILSNGVGQSTTNALEGLMLNLTLVVVSCIAATVTANLFDLIIVFVSASK